MLRNLTFQLPWVCEILNCGMSSIQYFKLKENPIERGAIPLLIRDLNKNWSTWDCAYGMPIIKRKIRGYVASVKKILHELSCSSLIRGFWKSRVVKTLKSIMNKIARGYLFTYSIISWKKWQFALLTDRWYEVIRQNILQLFFHLQRWLPSNNFWWFC